MQLKTKANQQWAAMRETQRRIRIALAEHHMLPSDPLRVYNTDQSNAAGAPTYVEEPAPRSPDSTAAKPKQVNPFTGEGMG